MDDTSSTKKFVFTSDSKPSPDLSNFKPFGHIDEDKPKYSAIMIIEDEGVYVPVINKPNMSISRSRTVLTGGSMMPTSSEASTRMLARKTNSTSSETSVPVIRGA